MALPIKHKLIKAIFASLLLCFASIALSYIFYPFTSAIEDITGMSDTEIVKRRGYPAQIGETVSSYLIYAKNDAAFQTMSEYVESRGYADIVHESAFEDVLDKANDFCDAGKDSPFSKNSVIKIVPFPDSSRSWGRFVILGDDKRHVFVHLAGY